jgi:hypothetical protein
MSTELTVLNNNNALAIPSSGFGASRIFKLKPATLELVHKSTRQDGAQPGKFRVTINNQHFEEMRVVMLAVPQEQREWYKDPAVFSKENKYCFSLDNITPHAKAKEAQALDCAHCSKGDINWIKYRAVATKEGKTAAQKHIPPCGKYWHLVVADRNTKRIYYFNVKGKSVLPFEYKMQEFTSLLNMMIDNVKAENKAIVAANAKLAADVIPTPLNRMPDIYDIACTIYVTQLEKGGSFVIGWKDFMAMNDEGRAEFGQTYLDFVNSRKTGNVTAQIDAEAEAEAAFNAVVEVHTQTFVAPTIPGGSVQGEVVSKDEPITI